LPSWWNSNQVGSALTSSDGRWPMASCWHGRLHVSRGWNEPIACSPELSAGNNLAHPFGAHIEPPTYRNGAYRCGAKQTSSFRSAQQEPDLQNSITVDQRITYIRRTSCPLSRQEPTSLATVARTVFDPNGHQPKTEISEHLSNIRHLNVLPRNLGNSRWAIHGR
jgi:hypothetical protein